MGSTCSAEQKEQLEDKAEAAIDAVKEVTEDIKAKVGEVIEEAKEIAEDVKEKVEEKVEHAKEVVADAQEAVASAAAGAQEKTEEVAETVQERAAEAVAEVKEAAANATEAVADTMTAARSAVTGTMIVEFDDGKGSTKTADFNNKALGFTFTRSGGGCCASAPKSKVVVSKVEKGKQADKLGVKRGWAIKAVNGTHVTGLEEATKLFDDGKSKLAEA